MARGSIAKEEIIQKILKCDVGIEPTETGVAVLSATTAYRT